MQYENGNPCIVCWSVRVMVLATFRTQRHTDSIGSIITRLGRYIPSKSRGSSMLHSVKTGSGAHRVSYPTDIGGSFPGSKATTLFSLIRGKGKVVSVLNCFGITQWTLWGSGGISPQLTSALDGGEWLASRPGTHWITDWVGPKAGLDAVEYRKISCPCSP
jgi:hypothetical protein